MNIALLLSMAAEGFGERIAVGDVESGLTYAALHERALAVAEGLRSEPGDNVVFVDVNSEVLPVLLFAASASGKRFVPLNYRLPDDQLRRVLARSAPGIVVAGPSATSRVGGVDGLRVVASEYLPVTSGGVPAVAPDASPMSVAVLLFTSGTTGEPKAAVLRHENLTSYIVGSVEFKGAGPDECAIVSVPPYHIAGISAVLSSVFAGRRIVYLEQFDAVDWVRTAREQSVTHAMVVPTMLARILQVLEDDPRGLPDLRHLSYGGGRMPLPVIEQALFLLPHVDFTNAYGLTETSSTVAVLTPEDHRRAISDQDPLVRARLGSVGRPRPSIELTVRDADGAEVGAGGRGEVWVRGPQVSGEYEGLGTRLDDGWFHTRDAGRLDDEGYLYVEGRLDDVIVRGGENISPGEVEDVLVAHPGIREAAVFGVPDVEWGEAVAAVLVPEPEGRPSCEEVADWVRMQLRSTKVPSHIEFRDALPYTDSGKLLRRAVRDDVVRGRRGVATPTSAT